MGVVVEHQVGAPQDRVGPPAAGAAEHSLDARHQLLQAERLDQVVVTPGREAPHLVLGGVAGGEEHDGRAPALLAPAAAHLEAVEVGQHHVEDDKVWLDRTDRLEGLPPRLDGVHVEPRVAQGRLEHRAQVQLVVDQEQAFTRHCPTLTSLPGTGLGGS
jgi:hypothetical protein